jgi:hypothetical protein
MTSDELFTIGCALRCVEVHSAKEEELMDEAKKIVRTALKELVRKSPEVNEAWKDEPELGLEGMRFRASGFECLITRHLSQGHLCGYIKVGANHPWYGKDYSNVDVEVHGGLSFAKTHDKTSTFGFDCAHLGDFTPYMASPPLVGKDDVYRDVGYVINQLVKLARQATEAV